MRGGDSGRAYGIPPDQPPSRRLQDGRELTTTRASRLGGWTHLVKRFFGFLRATPLSPRDQAEVRALLSEPESALFWQQRPEDQRHALEVARRTLIARPGDREVAAAALLHDVGKRHVRLGAWHRSVATVLDRLRLPLPQGYRAYRSHGPIGADDLAGAGSATLTVLFARHHPGAAPDGVDPERWRTLLDADHA